MVTLEPSVWVNGVQWFLYAVDFTTDEGTYSVYVYALDQGHAQMRVEDLKETATLRGQLL